MRDRGGWTGAYVWTEADMTCGPGKGAQPGCLGQSPHWEMKEHMRTKTCWVPLALAAVLVCHTGIGLRVALAEELFVAPDGRPDNAGLIDSPLSFEDGMARLSRVLKSSGVPEGGLTLTLLAGHYRFTNRIVLGEQFAGTADRPITVRAQPGATVVFDGGAEIAPEGFGPVTDPAERARLARSAVDEIRVKTITDPALVTMLEGKLLLTLTFNGQVYLPSVFPNQGYAMMDNDAVVPEVTPPGIPVGQEGYGIRAGHPPHQEPGKPLGWKGTLDEPRGAQVGIAQREDEMAGTWAQWEAELKRNNTRNIHTGFIDANWLLRSQPLVGASAEDRCMHLSSALSYGWAWRKDKPFKVFGLLCELDQPGEWHFDPLTDRLYLYPPEPLTADTRIGLPLAAGFMELKGATHVRVIGLNVQNVGSRAVYAIEGGHHNLIAGCRIQNSTALGVRLSGEHNGIRGCDLVDLDSHVWLGGGRRSPDEITPGHNYVENCHLYQRGFRHQKVNVSIRGVGQRFRHNLVHNSLGQAVTISGNDHLLEFNELFNIGYDEGDGGAMYAGADLAGYGVVYRYNFFHHLMHVPGKVERSGIHLDDLQAGSTCIGNIFYKSAAKGIFMNGGAGHTLLNNVFLEGYRGIYNSGGHAQKDFKRQEAIFADPHHMYRHTKENYIGRTEQVVGPEGWKKSPWMNRYPLFHQVMSDTGRFGRFWPIRCRIEGNLYYGNTRTNATEWSRVAPEARAKSVIRDDGLVSPEDFVDYENLDLRFRRDDPDLPSIPFERIGLYLGEYRSSMPSKAHYRRAIKEFFKGIGSMPGTTKQIDTAEVVETGPLVTR